MVLDKRSSSQEPDNLDLRSTFETAAKHLALKDKQGLRYATKLLDVSGVSSSLRNTYIREASRLLEQSSVTFAHSLCVTGLCLDFVDYDNGDVGTKQALGGAILHDIGKLGLEHRIRSRKANLKLGDDDLLRTHSYIGAGMLSEFPMPAYLSGSHHILPNNTGYGVLIALPDNMLFVAQQARLVLSVYDFIDAMEHGDGNSMTAPKFDRNDKQTVIRTMSDLFFTPIGGAIVEKNLFIERAVEFYWRHHPLDSEYKHLMDTILGDISNRKRE